MHIAPRSERAATHRRVASGDDRRRVAIPRRLTTDPLAPASDDAVGDDPLAVAAASNQASSLPARVLSPVRSEAPPRSPAPPSQQQQQHGASQSRGGLDDMPSKDFSFLQDPASYHVLPATSIAGPFLNAPNVPPISSPIDSLLVSGHYRLAAIAAARNIVTAAAPSDYATLFHLVHVRLACLCLIQEHALAAQEAKVLGDLNSVFYHHPVTNAHLVPWDLRLLVVRLAALGYGEWRKGIMGYYELARECREQLAKPSPSDEQTLWRARLRDCGIRVANVLVEMGDLEGAGRHLGTLCTPDDAADSAAEREVLLMETLVWLRVGDIRAARRCLSRASAAADADALLDGTLAALMQLADSEYDAATASLRALHEQFPADAMVTQNLAVCLLYVGCIAEAKQLLGELLDESLPFHSLVFNMSTVYELCTEKNREKKLALAAKLAARKEGGGVGWELSSVAFKM